MSGHSGSVGCTVGVIQRPAGMLFFKNRDLEGTYVRNRTTVFRSSAASHALQGVNLETGSLEGVSIGVNRHKVCVANTHVLSTHDATYDLLCEKLLEETHGELDVQPIVTTFLRERPVQGGRILVAAPGWAYLVEVLGKRFELQATRGDMAITNTFSLLPHPRDASESREQSSRNRQETASRMLHDIGNAGQLKSMLRSHLPEKGELAICNHRRDGGGTESSHIIQIHGDYVTWSHLVGFPCENDFRTTELFN